MAVSLAEEAYLDPLAARSEQNEAMEDPLTDPSVQWRKNLAGSSCTENVSFISASQAL
ncbi:hypothetical protein ACRRTK_023951 [Alexandromys fortis]